MTYQPSAKPPTPQTKNFAYFQKKMPMAEPMMPEMMHARQ
jgi:hypothetical protein